MVYRWAARLPGNAQACGEELQRLQQQHDGSLTPEIVVTAASSDDNPLHRCFEWSNDVAAKRYREDQARAVIRSIRVVVTGEDGQAQEQVRCFVNIDGDEDGERRYVATAKLEDDAQLFERVRTQFLKDMHVFERRYRDFLSLRQLIERVRLEAEQVPLHVSTDQSGTVGPLEAGR